MGFMSGQTLSPSDKRVVLVALAIAVASVLYIRANFSAGFPEASIDLRLSREEITSRAEAFLHTRGWNPSGFRNLTLFDPDDDARTYLERELDLREANRLMSGPVSVWRWRARWFRPPDKEEFLALLAPDGRVVGFQHVVAEATPGERVSKEAARAEAAEFLRGFTAAPQRLVEEQLQERPNRYDYTFTWEQEDFKVKDATYRRTVEVQGSGIGRYEEYLYVPEAWKRDFAKLRSRNELYSQIAVAAWLPLILAALAVILLRIRKRDIPWRTVAIISGFVAVLAVFNGWNTLPFFIDRSPTSSPYNESALSGILQALGSGVGVFFYVLVAAAAGEPLYRARFPDRVRLSEAISGRGIRTREFFLSTVTGYAFAAFHIAFVAAFYIYGKRFGVWSPQDVAYSDLVSTVVPWIYPLAISAMAAASEEFWFRLFAIPLLARKLPLWIAVVAPAFVWGFLHANYPQQPAYIRGVEVGIIGVAAGWLMLRYGILATLIWHYTVDAALIGIFLFRAGAWYLRASGVVVAGAIAIPLLIAVVSYRRYGGFVPLERGEPVLEPEAETVETAPVAEPLAPAWPARRLYLAAGAVALSAIAAVLLLRPVRYGAREVWVSRPEAESIAVREMAGRGIDVASWMRGTEFVTNLNAAEFEYIRRIAGPAAADAAVRERTFSAIWFTRFYRPLQKEEYRAYTDQRGHVYRVDHMLDEKAPGAQLTPEDARGIAERYLLREGVPVGRYRLVDSQEEKRDRRTDHTFTWEDPAFSIGEAKARIYVEVVGDEASAYRRFIKLPEAWLRDFERPRVRGYLLPGLIGAFAVPVLLILLRRLGSHYYHWRAYFAIGGVALAVSALAAANNWPAVGAEYDTSTPLGNYYAQVMLSRVLIVVFGATGAMLGALTLDVFRQWLAGERRINTPSVLRAAGVAVLLAGFGRLVSALDSAIPGPRLALPLWSVTGVGSLVPGYGAIAQAFPAALVELFAGGVLVMAALRIFSMRARWIVLALLAFAFAVSRSQTIPQGVFSAAAVVAAAGIVALLARTCAMDLISFGVALFWLEAMSRSAGLIAQPAALLRWTGVVAAAVALAAGALVIRRFSTPLR